MYLRKNKVRCGGNLRTYIAIAHNVWWPGENGARPQSRPIVIASLGSIDDLDLELAADLVVAVERSVPEFTATYDTRREATLDAARTVKRIEPFLRLVAGRNSGLCDKLPSTTERITILEALVRDKLGEAEAAADPSRAPMPVRAHLAAVELET